MGWLSDIWDGIRGKVESLISSALTDFKSWVRARIASAVDAITQVYNTFKTYITNVYNTTYNYLSNTYNTFKTYISNVYNTTQKYISNVYKTTNNYITNVVGASQEWVDARVVDMRAYVDSRIALLDPTNFLANPPVYISGVFSLLGLAKESNIAESFLAGFIEGLEEDTEE